MSTGGLQKCLAFRASTLPLDVMPEPMNTHTYTYLNTPLNLTALAWHPTNALSSHAHTDVLPKPAISSFKSTVFSPGQHCS